MQGSTLASESPSEIVGALIDGLAPASSYDKEKDQRRHHRHPFPQNVSVISGSGLDKITIHSRAFDISKTGVCVEIKGGHLFENGTKLKIQLSPIANVIGTEHPPKKQTIEAVVTRSWRVDGDTWIYGLRFDGNIENERAVRLRNFKKIASSVLVVVGIMTIMALKINDLRWFWYAPLYRMYGLLGGAFFLSRAFFSLIYREPKDNGYMPNISIIISVKNEQSHIAETVKRVFGVRYPLNKMELIVIDDGSTDDTWGELEKVKPNYPRLRLFRFPENLGKRHGMALGAREASGEILVYVDSDSYVDEEGIYKLVQPFADRSVGAVAGHTRVIVEKNNVISKMESVRYFISHQLFKTAESIFGSVTCCPGAFSAYRRDVVLRVLPQWLNQTFLGVKATFGDDRSLTNHVLRTHRVLYHSGAICVTYVPTTWKQFFTQQLRWKKSWARETTVAARVLLRKHPLAVISYYIGTVVTLLSPLVFLRAVVVGPLLMGTSCLPYLVGVVFVYLFLCLFFLFQTGERHWPYGLLFAFSYLSILCWQTYWAILTVNKTKWGTR